MAYDKCPICHEYPPLFGVHRCPPAWEVSSEDPLDPYFSGWHRVYSNHEDDAATKYAEDIFYHIDCPSEFDLWVRKPDEETAQKYEISVEPVPTFSAAKSGEAIAVPEE
jgi:hypothetical protein